MIQLRRLLRPMRAIHGRRALPLALVLALLPTLGLSQEPSPIVVVVSGAREMLPRGTTLGEARRVLGIEPAAGDVIDVEGIPLRRGVYPGFLRVNGRAAPDSLELAAGDTIEAVDARDHIEPVTVRIVPVPEGGIPNPQTHLGFVPGEQVITTGAMSGKLVSSAFRPTGRSAPPPAVALTFDDGPSATYTPRILRILRQRHVEATFFMVGYLVRRYPGVARDVVAAGMAVGNHSMHHIRTRPFAELPPHEVEDQIRAGKRVVEALGVESVGFRPPGGSWSAAVLDAASRLEERTILWSVDAEDWEQQSPATLARRVVNAAEPGSIILLHDGGGNRQPTVEALPRIISGLRQRGFDLVALTT